MKLSFRTALFIDRRAISASAEPRLIICQTSNWAPDAVHRWKSLTRRKAARKKSARSLTFSGTRFRVPPSA